MTRRQLEAAWRKSRANPFEEVKTDSGIVVRLKASSVHSEFTDQMAKKTVLARAAKIIVNTSDDACLYVSEHDEAIDSVEVVRATATDAHAAVPAEEPAAIEDHAQEVVHDVQADDSKKEPVTDTQAATQATQETIPGVSSTPRRRSRWER